MYCNDAVKRSKRLERKPWNVDDRQRGGVGLSHPRRQQNAASVRLFDDKVGVVRMDDAAERKDALAATRMMRISDNNFERLFLGSMS
jgi:hypothetical protein